MAFATTSVSRYQKDLLPFSYIAPSEPAVIFVGCFCISLLVCLALALVLAWPLLIRNFSSLVDKQQALSILKILLELYAKIPIKEKKPFRLLNLVHKQEDLLIFLIQLKFVILLGRKICVDIIV